MLSVCGFFTFLAFENTPWYEHILLLFAIIVAAVLVFLSFPLSLLFPGVRKDSLIRRYGKVIGVVLSIHLIFAVAWLVFLGSLRSMLDLGFGLSFMMRISLILPILGIPATLFLFIQPSLPGETDKVVSLPVAM